ncbi:MAG TPA: ABC transporter ATP-binding protein [Candidatus Elarobacter sp.]|jgi:putative ABC transport system ATP-binding protein
MTSPAAADVSDAFVSYERWGVVIPALRGVTLWIRPGEWLVVYGANGAGKSTLLDMLAGARRPNQGSVRVFGSDPAKFSSRRRAQTIFRVRQNPEHGTAPTLTVREHLFLADRSRPPRVRASSGYYQALLDDRGLDVRLSQLAGALSGGQRQLLALIMAELSAAPLILLDEPFASLDIQRRKLAYATLKKLHAAERTLVLVTHEPSDVTLYATAVARVEEGHVTKDGTLAGEVRCG